MKYRVTVRSVENQGSPAWQKVTLEYQQVVMGTTHTRTAEVIMAQPEWAGLNPPPPHDWPPQVGDQFDMAIIAAA